MTYRILIFSEEEENFVMEVIASPSTTFHELHTLIMEACGYTETGDHQFLICDEAWKVKEKIHLHSPQSIGLDEDLYMMDEVRLEEFLEEEGQHIAYIYETSSRKTLLLELVESLFGRKTDDAHVSRRKGTAPVQFDDRESEELTTPKTTIPNTSDPYEDDTEESDDADLFSADELDSDGFEVNEI